MSARVLPTERRLSLLLLLVAASQRMGQLVDRELAAEGVDGADYALLSLIGVRGPVRLTEVAAELGMPLTTGSDAIRRLEADGRVERIPNPDDRRSSLFRLSPTGDAAWRRGWPALRRVDAGLAQALDDPVAVRTALEELGAAFEGALTEK
jgi:DNA-binding MarR family transcriptional regulator